MGHYLGISISVSFGNAARIRAAAPRVKVYSLIPGTQYLTFLLPKLRNAFPGQQWATAPRLKLMQKRRRSQRTPGPRVATKCCQLCGWHRVSQKGPPVAANALARISSWPRAEDSPALWLGAHLPNACIIPTRMKFTAMAASRTITSLLKARRVFMPSTRAMEPDNSITASSRAKFAARARAVQA